MIRVCIVCLFNLVLLFFIFNALWYLLVWVLLWILSPCWCWLSLFILLLFFPQYMRSQYICVTAKFYFFFFFAFQAEKIASRMIYEDRMRGSIDQVWTMKFWSWLSKFQTFAIIKDFIGLHHNEFDIQTRFNFEGHNGLGNIFDQLHYSWAFIVTCPFISSFFSASGNLCCNI